VCLYVYPPIVARQRLNRYVTAVTNTHATIEELDSSFSMCPVSWKLTISSSQHFLLKTFVAILMKYYSCLRCWCSSDLQHYTRLISVPASRSGRFTIHSRCVSPGCQSEQRGGLENSDSCRCRGSNSDHQPVAFTEMYSCSRLSTLMRRTRLLQRRRLTSLAYLMAFPQLRRLYVYCDAIE
jgi:hypothetical protein